MLTNLSSIKRPTPQHLETDFIEPKGMSLSSAFLLISLSHKIISKVFLSLYDSAASFQIIEKWIRALQLG